MLALLPLADEVFVAGGYIRVYQDVRGKYGSEGEYVMTKPVRGTLNTTGTDHATDAYDTIDWLVKNVPESNGRVGMIGSSYEGFTVVMALLEPHPALKVAAPESPMVDGWMGDDWFHYGAFRQTNFDYFSGQNTKRGEGDKIARGEYDDYDAFRRAGSAGDFARQHGLDQLPWNEKIMEHPSYDAFWQGQALDRLVAQRPTAVPTMWLQGLWDQEDMWGAIHCYLALKKAGQVDHNYLVMGPWRHSQVNAEGYMLGPLHWDGDTTAQFRRDVLRPFFDQYLKSAKVPSFDRLNVSVPEFFKTVNQALGSVPIKDWKPYLRWHLVHSLANALPSKFVDEDFRFYGTVLRGTKEQQARWKRCVVATDASLGEALGQRYAEENFGQEGKSRTRQLVKQVEGALERDITSLPWMGDATKKRALEKLHAIANKIGYPDKWRDYSSVEVVRDDYLGNTIRARAFEHHRRLGEIGKPTDRNEWRMTPPTVNAYYAAPENSINFPAGILQPPFYDPNLDDAVNLGAIGGVIGHELTHGFDDSGRKFDAVGNLENWWTPEDGKEFEKRATCLADEYSSFVAIKDPLLKVNGRLTLGENTADNGGLRVAHMALQESLAGKEAPQIEGFTPEQRLFLAYAQIWCENRTQESMRLQITSNPHSPGRFRVIGVMQNMPEFQKAFSCKAGQPLVPKTQCRVW